MSHWQPRWATPSFVELKMDAEIGSYQEDRPEQEPPMTAAPQQRWAAPSFAEVKMDAEIGSYQEDAADPGPPMTLAHSPHSRSRGRSTALLSLIGALLTITSVTPARALNPPVWTQKLNQFRNGWNPWETILHGSSIGGGALTRKATWNLPSGSGQIVSQLLYDPQVVVNYPSAQGTFDLVIATTTQGWIVIYDANHLVNNPTPLFQVNLNTIDPSFVPNHTSPACNDKFSATQPWTGITSTPHIAVPTTGHHVLYLVDKAVPPGAAQDCISGSITQLPTSTFFRIWGIDVQTGGIIHSPIHISQNQIKSTDGSNVWFDPTLQDQRAGLLVWNDQDIYIGFGAMPDDHAGWHGWLMDFNANLSTTPKHVWLSTPEVIGNNAADRGVGGSIWQGGNGIAVSPSQDEILVATGNGPTGSQNGLTDYSDSLVEFGLSSSSMPLQHSYLPELSQEYETADIDFGSAGPVVTRLNTAVQVGKDGIMRNFDGENLAPAGSPFHATFPQYNGCYTRLVQPQGSPNCNTPGGCATEGAVDQWPRFYNGPIAWDNGSGIGAVFVWSAEDYPRSYPYINGFGLGFFQNVRLTSSNDRPDMRVKYCDDLTCLSGCSTAPPGNPYDNFYVADNTVGSVLAPDGTSGAALELTGVPGGPGADGLLWASINFKNYGAPASDDAEFHLQYGRLYAFGADTLNELWFNTDTYILAKWSPPIITNGHVFLPGLQTTGAHDPPATSDLTPTWDSEILVYGL